MSTASTIGFRPVRLGVVGLGQFGRLHALTAAGIAESELVALVDRNERQLSNVAQDVPGIGRWTDLNRAIEESGAEAWIVATSTASHVAVAQKLLAAGKHVLLEKPIAEGLAEAESLAPLVQTDSGNLMLGHVVLFNSEFRQLLREAQIRGSIAYIDCVRHRPTTTLDRFPGENPLHLTMVHDLYMTLALMAREEPVRMCAQMHRRADGRCDLAHAYLEWSSGTIASLTASFMTPPGMPADGFDRMEVFGEGWAARIQPNPRPIEIWDNACQWPMNLEIQAGGGPPTGMLAEQLRCFCRVVRKLDRVPIGATYPDGLQVQRWIERLRASAVEG